METFKNETELVNYLIHRLNSNGHFVWRNNSGGIRSTYTDKTGRKKERFWRAGVKGSSDILGIAKDGRFIAIECKHGKNKPTPSQIEFIKDITDRNGYGVVARSYEDLPDQLKGGGTNGE